MKRVYFILTFTFFLLVNHLTATAAPPTSGNPVFDGWYADPEGVIFGDKYWIFPTYSAPYDEQLFFDCFSSPDLVTWTKHPRVLEAKSVTWAKRAMWAPSVIEKDGKYYFFFAANDIQNDESLGGIGVAIADKPDGPYKDYLGKPLIDKFHNGAQPIDQSVSQDDDGTTFREVTPTGYVEGPFMFRRDGKSKGCAPIFPCR